MTWGELQNPEYGSAEAWVSDWLSVHYAHPMTNGRVFCPDWTEHPEAVSRLEALWREWERVAADGGRGMAAFWIGLLDPMMAALTDEHGPFAHCRRGHTDRLAPLPVQATDGL
jgi:hypothetical protein